MDTKRLLSDYVRAFNAQDEETFRRAVPNDRAEDWMLQNVPRVAVPDEDIQRTYYFRWWTFRKHIRETEDGFVLTEFLPDVDWAGLHNTISCAVGHHIREGRWLRDSSFLDDYIRFWYGKGMAHLHVYSNWLEAAVGSLARVRGDGTGLDLTDDMVKNLDKWADEQLTASGLYWSIDSHDGSEYSVSGTGLRLTINCYQYGGLIATAELLEHKDEFDKAALLRKRAQTLLQNMEKLWDEEKRFYIAIPQLAVDSAPFRNEQRRVRELYGYLPWMFGAAKPGRTDAFLQLLDKDGFNVKYGPGFVEKRHPLYAIQYTGEETNAWLRSRGDHEINPKGAACLWNGPTWPYASCLALTALANLLTDDEKQDFITADDYLALLKSYAFCHRLVREDGSVVPWIDEDLHPDTGEWIARKRRYDLGGIGRGKDYNHSTFCDLVLEGLFGIRPDYDSLTVAPLFPAGWDYASVEDVRVHGKSLSIFYTKKDGYRVLIDGEEKFRADRPEKCVLNV